MQRSDAATQSKRRAERNTERADRQQSSADYRIYCRGKQAIIEAAGEESDTHSYHLRGDEFYILTLCSVCKSEISPHLKFIETIKHNSFFALQIF